MNELVPIVIPGRVTQHSVEGVENEPTRERLAMSTVKLVCGSCAFDDEDRDVAELDLVDGAVAVRASPVGLGCVGADVWDVADERPAW